MATKITPKNSLFFECELCHFKCCKNNDFKRHIETKKHKNNEMLQNTTKITQKSAKKYICKCGKEYSHHSSLYKHKKTCKKSEIIITDNNEDEEIDYKKMLKTAMEENAKLIGHIGELIPKVGNGNTNINNNQKININIFLNEECKDALSIDQFIDKIKVSMDNLLLTKDKGINEGVADIFIENMNKLSIKERPMHCTDPKREVLYIKNDGWEKDINNDGLKEALKKISYKQSKSLDKWTEAHPNYLNNEKEREEYSQLINSATDELDLKENKTIKKICNNIHLKN
jgi:hypothetical protein